MTYIGFEKEDAAKQVNWSSVTTGFAKNISSAISTREERKKAIDDKITSDLLKIADTKQGKHQGVNEAQANLANQYTSMMLENQKNLKNGNLSVREWTTMQNNAMSGANAIYGAIETLNTQYDTMLKGYDEGTISGAAVQLWEGYSTLLDTNNQALYVEPTTGKTFVGSLDENGDIDMGTLNTVETVLGALQQDYPAFDMNNFLEGEVESIAEFSIYANEPDGKYGKKINSPKIANSYKNWKNNVINEALTKPKNTLSILVDNKQGYKLTTNKQEWENDKTGLLIYHQQTDDNSGIVDFQFTDAQIDAAKSLLDHDIEMSVGYEEEADTRKDRTENLKGTGISPDDIISNINLLTTGGEQAELGEQILRENYNKNVEAGDDTIQTIRTNKDGYTIVFNTANGVSEREIKTGGNATQEQRVKTLYEFLQPNQSSEASWSSVYTNQDIVKIGEGGLGDYSGSKIVTQVEPQSLDVLKTSYDGPSFSDLATKIGKIKGEDREAVYQQFLNTALKSTGADLGLINLEVSINAKGSNDTVTLTANGEQVGEPFEWDSTFFGKKDYISQIKAQTQKAYNNLIKYHNNSVTNNPQDEFTAQANAGVRILADGTEVIDESPIGFQKFAAESGKRGKAKADYDKYVESFKKIKKTNTDTSKYNNPR